MKNKGVWSALFFGTMLFISGMRSLLLGDMVWREVLIPSWTGWLTLGCSLLCFIVAVYGFWKGGPSSAEIAQEAARAKAEMDRLYFQEHGHWPEERRPPGEPPPGA